MSSWIGWLTRPRKTVQHEESSFTTPLETDSMSLNTKQTSTPIATSTSSDTNSPTKPLIYPLNPSGASPSAPLFSDVIRDDYLDAQTNSKTDTTNTTSRVEDSHLSEKELTQIKEENVRLKSVLKQIQRNPASTASSAALSVGATSPYSFQHVGHIPGGNGFLLSIPSLSGKPSSGLKGSAVPASSSSSSSSAAVSLSPPSYAAVQQEKQDALLCHGEHSTVLVKQLKEESDKENAVALLDLNEVDWWVMVNGEGKEKETPTDGESVTSVEVDDDDRVHREGGLRIVKSYLAYDNEGYVLIDENDFILALSDFISQSISRQYPEAERIPPQELQKILRQAFTPIKQPSAIGKAYQWAQFLYSSYSWGSCAWSLYREPFYVKLVLRGAMKAAQWLLVLVI